MSTFSSPTLPAAASTSCYPRRRLCTRSTTVLRSSSSNAVTRTHSKSRSSDSRCRSEGDPSCHYRQVWLSLYRGGCKNGYFKATFVTYASQIASKAPTQPSLASCIINYITESIVADASSTNTSDTDTSTNSTVERGANNLVFVNPLIRYPR